MKHENQQELSVHGIAVIALRAPTNRLVDTTLLMPAVLDGLLTAPRGMVTFIG